MKIQRAIPAELDLFFRRNPEIQKTRGSIVIKNTDSKPGIYYLTKGVVRQYAISPEGNEVTVNIFKPFSFFPLSWTIGKVQNRHAFMAVTDCSYHLMPASETLHFLHDKPEILLDLLNRLFSGIDGLMRRLEHALAGSARTNVQLNLVLLAYRFGVEGRDNKITIPVRMTHAEIGTMAGIARETVSRELAQLEVDGLIAFEKSTIVIPDLKKLEASLSG